MNDMIHRFLFPENKAVTKACALVTVLNSLKDSVSVTFFQEYHNLERPVKARAVNPVSKDYKLDLLTHSIFLMVE